MKKIKTKDLKEGQIIWNNKSKFDNNIESIHPNLIVNDKGYSMTSLKRDNDTRLEYNRRDLVDPPALGTMYSGKYVTKYTNDLTEEEYSYYATMKKNWVSKFKQWLNK